MEADNREPTGALRTTGRRWAALALAGAGLMVLLGSFGDWVECSTTDCYGGLMSFSEMSGLDVGYGVLTAIAGILLTPIGMDAICRRGQSRFGTLATLLGCLVFVTVTLFVVDVYVFADESMHLWGPPAFAAFLTGGGGLIALAAGLRLSLASSSVQGPAPPTRR
jgi:hypothetical protein